MKTLTFCLALIASSYTLASGQTYKVLYNFGANGATDAAQPWGTLIADKSDNLYGTTALGGNATDFVCVSNGGCGTVYELSPNVDGSWSETVLYNFCSLPDCADGEYPGSGLILDDDGNLYGTTIEGAVGGEYGTVFELSPPSLPGGTWTEKVLWAFGGNEAADGCLPEAKLIFDSAGSLYGTTGGCGAGKNAEGTVFKLTPGDGGSWTEDLLHTFRGTNISAPGGIYPASSVTLDLSGNLYGTTSAGGTGLQGVAYQLSLHGSTWAETVLHSFTQASGAVPSSAVSFDQAGNLYGTLYNFGSKGGSCAQNGCGGIFRISRKNGSSVTSILRFSGLNGGNPEAGLLLNGAKGYGTTLYGGAQGQGTIFAAQTNGVTVLHDFCSQAACADGSQPIAGLISDGAGNYYGVTTIGGTFNQGVVFEITP